MIATIPAVILEHLNRKTAPTVHELSIAMRIVDLACEHVATCQEGDVESVHVAIGVLTQVHEPSLKFGFEVASQGTAIEGSRLEVRWVPIAIYCHACQRISESTSLQELRCPICSSAATEVRSGDELDLEFLSLRPSSTC